MPGLCRFRSNLPNTVYREEEQVLDDTDRQGLIRDWESLPVPAERRGNMTAHIVARQQK